MDLKVNGLPYGNGKKPLRRPAKGRLHIMGRWLEPWINHEITNRMHHALSVLFAGEFIGAVIGPGGKVIQEMQSQPIPPLLLLKKERMVL